MPHHNKKTGRFINTSMTFLPEQLDQIQICDLRINAMIGIHSHEQNIEQLLLVNAWLFVQKREQGTRDDIQTTVDYQIIAEHISGHAKAHHFQLIETLALELAAQCLALDKRIEAVRIQVDKPSALENAASTCVSIFRTRAELS